MEDNLRSAADLPYFEGDFWPNVLEESIKELDQEEEEKRKQAEAAEAAVRVNFWNFSLELFFSIVFYFFRFSHRWRKTKSVQTVKRRAKRKQRKVLRVKRINGKTTARNRIRLRRVTICRRKYLRRWISIRKFSSLLDYILCSQPQV